MSLPNKSKALEHYVNGKVLALQERRSSSGGRATLSRLRRDINGMQSSWMDIGNDLYSDWPTDLLGNPDSDRAVAVVNAVSTALGIYALHQQSQSYAVAQHSEGKPISFGKACRMISSESTDEPDKGIIRRLMALESAPTFEGELRQLRSLIMLMRASANPVQLHYGMFASDLYQIQLPEKRTSVFQRWSRDFYYNNTSQQSAKNNNK